MKSLLKHRERAWRGLFHLIFLILATGLLLPCHLQGDMPKTGMATLMIDDLGDQLIFRWHFFYRQMPATFVLHEKQDKPISLESVDTAQLNQNLSDIAEVAFDLKIDGRTVQPKILRLTPYPDKSCAIILSYPGHTGGNVEVRAPILHYLPPNYLINIRLSNLTGRRGAFFGRQFPAVVRFVQGKSRFPNETPLFSNDLQTEFGAAWINYNWILTCAVLLLLRQLKQVAVLVTSIVTGWIFFCFASSAANFNLPFLLPEIALCLPTLLVCVICVYHQKNSTLINLLTVAAGLLNACFDFQQIPFSAPALTITALIGLSLGFIGGTALVLLVLVTLWWECQKYPSFQENWAPRISWVIVILACLLPLQKWLFG